MNLIETMITTVVSVEYEYPLLLDLERTVLKDRHHPLLESLRGTFFRVFLRRTLELKRTFLGILPTHDGGDPVFLRNTVET